ncbi:Atg38p Ecym_8075 [Eremothecium cymbalariae DBVPG|uniref:Uncharacterized protein n=1 Tax=Eremothecium cymbalariae (strain CBS 270.75 / DBVPG 7215 / KCTC 17166 / NRRL Y-17582) TaxID=931890 RepID=G8JWZ7_ERECY|nr:Hypothetical protein Ecym_8075 [Eremothecium cymbalariae DBVPG\
MTYLLTYTSVQIYEHIEIAEQHCIERNYQNASKEYEHVLEQLESLVKDLALNGDLKRAIMLLKEDIELKVKELEQWDQRKQPTPANTTQGLSTNNKSSPGRVIDMNMHLNNANPITDPFLASIINKLQTNILQVLTQQFAGEAKTAGQKEVSCLVTQQIAQFQKEIAIFEQRKFREYDTKMDQLIKENKKLSNQVVRLKDRWDSLVESAKQKRNQQERQ